MSSATALMAQIKEQTKILKKLQAQYDLMMASDGSDSDVPTMSAQDMRRVAKAEEAAAAAKAQRQADKAQAALEAAKALKKTAKMSTYGAPSGSSTRVKSATRSAVRDDDFASQYSSQLQAIADILVMKRGFDAKTVADAAYFRSYLSTKSVDDLKSIAKYMRVLPQRTRAMTAALIVSKLTGVFDEDD